MSLLLLCETVRLKRKSANLHLKQAKVCLRIIVLSYSLCIDAAVLLLVSEVMISLRLIQQTIMKKLEALKTVLQ